MRLSVVPAAALLVLLAGCSADAPPPLPTPSAVERATSTPRPAPVTTVATAVVDVVEVFAAEDAATPDRVLDRREETSGELVFVVEQDAGDRLLVQLPVRPNGSTGWVDAGAVTLTENPYALEVGLSDHELVLRRSGTVVLRAPIGVGTADTPTPGGTYYVKELLAPPDPTGAYGPYAYGLSGFSTELLSFAGGEGVIGIHGTNAPEAIGTDVSSGCIRLSNELITRLVEEVGLPLGTPVEIRA